MNTNDYIRKKAYGIMKSIESMNENEKLKNPSESYGMNYNNLREAFIDNNKDLYSFSPPEVLFDNYGSESGTYFLTRHNYCEIHTFCSEIYYILE